MTVIAVFSGGPNDGKRLSWDGGDFIFVAEVPPISFTPLPVKPAAIVRSIRRGVYKFARTLGVGVERYDWCGWDDEQP